MADNQMAVSLQLQLYGMIISFGHRHRHTHTHTASPAWTRVEAVQPGVVAAMANSLLTVVLLQTWGQTFPEGSSR